MREFKVAITIAASPERVWAVLADTGAYPKWDPGGERIVGRLAAGERILIYAPPRPERAFRARVTECVGGHKLAWRGGLPLGLFTRERTIILTARDSQTTKLSLRESFGGPLSGLFKESLPGSAEPLQRFAAAVKKQAESPD